MPSIPNTPNTRSKRRHRLPDRHPTDRGVDTLYYAAPEEGDDPRREREAAVTGDGGSGSPATVVVVDSDNESEPDDDPLDEALTGLSRSK